MQFLIPEASIFLGATRWGSGIEIPAHDQDIYALKNVPMGRCVRFYSFLKDKYCTQGICIYPTRHDKIQTTIPVLYLQHGFEKMKLLTNQGSFQFNYG